jgi:hypothetical protein
MEQICSRLRMNVDSSAANQIYMGNQHLAVPSINAALMPLVAQTKRHNRGSDLLYIIESGFIIL